MLSSKLTATLAPHLGRRCFSYAGGRVPPTTQNVIGGEWQESKTDRWIDVHNPATNEVVTRSVHLARLIVHGKMFLVSIISKNI